MQPFNFSRGAAWLPNPHPLIDVLRKRRLYLRMGQSELAKAARLNLTTLQTHENQGRCRALENFERWAKALGYRLTLTPIEEEGKQ